MDIDLYRERYRSTTLLASFDLLNELCHGKAQQCKKEESDRLRGAGDKIKVIDLRFERWQVVGFGKGRRRQCFPSIACSWDE